MQKPRWNFRKANWPEFTKIIAESINRIPPQSENNQSFCKRVIAKAKKYIPRGVRKSCITCRKMKARPYSKSTKRIGILISVSSSWEDASYGLKKWQLSISHTRADEHGIRIRIRISFICTTYTGCTLTQYLNMIIGYNVWIRRPLLRAIWSISQRPPWSLVRKLG